MRVFIGAFLNSPEIKEKYHEFINKSNDLFTGKWVEDENLHFTFHFLGEYPDDKISELQTTLSSILKKYDEKIIIKSLMGFPHINNPRQIVCKLYSPSKGIFKIHKRLSDLFVKNNIQFDEKNYLPHMTLVRVKSLLPDFETKFEDLRYFDFGEIHSFEVKLIKSTLTVKGPIYEAL
jgi:2'-5' RNA ligase